MIVRFHHSRNQVDPQVLAQPSNHLKMAGAPPRRRAPCWAWIFRRDSYQQKNTMWWRLLFHSTEQTLPRRRVVRYHQLPLPANTVSRITRIHCPNQRNAWSLHQAAMFEAKEPPFTVFCLSEIKSEVPNNQRTRIWTSSTPWILRSPSTSVLWDERILW